MNEQRQMRLIFSKMGNIRFISHLDMTRAFLRAFQRSEIELKLSEGFSPHPKVSFPMPLSVGMESENEILDFTLAETENKSEEEMTSLLNMNLPDGIAVKKMYVATVKSQAIEYAEYDITIPEFPRPCGIEEMFNKPLFIMKKTKKGKDKEIDIKSGIKKIAFENTADGTKIFCTLKSSGAEYLNPSYILSAMREKYPDLPEYARIKRIRALDGAEIEFI